MAPWVHGYLCRDGGGVLENLRTSRGDHTGQSMGFAHLDEGKLQHTGDPEWPFNYQAKQGHIKMHRSQVSPLVDMRDGRDQMLGVGYCGLSRTLATSHLLMDIVTYKREMLSDMPPVSAAGEVVLHRLRVEQDRVAWTDGRGAGTAYPWAVTLGNGNVSWQLGDGCYDLVTDVGRQRGAGGTANVFVIVDGDTLVSETLEGGPPHELIVNVCNVDRLEVAIRGQGRFRAVFGNARLVERANAPQGTTH